jgi:hypothetical protein
MVIVVNIDTTLWYKIISLLKTEDWRVVYKYDEFDAGIDFDFVVFEKDGQEILMGWDNWVEGEIKCSENCLQEIEKLTGARFNLGAPVNLKPEVISLYRKV